MGNERDIKNKFHTENTPCNDTPKSLLDGEKPTPKMLKSIVATATDCFISLNEQGELLAINKAVENLFGYTAKELIGCSITKLLPDLYCNLPQSPPTHEALERHETPMYWHRGREAEGRHKDGSMFPVELSLSEVQTAEGLIFVGILQNIAQRKRAQENLRLAKEAAEAANHAKSDFLANMSHELTTPLNFILGFSDVLLTETAGPLTAKQRDYIERIRGGGKRLNNLLKDILDLSRVEADTTTVSPISFILGELLRASLVLHKEKALKHSIALNLEAESVAQISMITDPMILKKILFQLLSNAMKFTPDGGKIIVRAVMDQTTDGFVFISVEDNGIGIAKENMPRLFTKFCQLESPLTKKYKGTGLGLALAKQLVELLGGTITATSAQGQGSQFTLHIPCIYQTDTMPEE